MKKKTSYQKLKDKIAELHSDLYAMVGDDKVKKVTVTMKWKLIAATEKQIMIGSPTKTNPQ